jgi:predicted DNA-binding transcriptional regulator AlpA
MTEAVYSSMRAKHAAEFLGIARSTLWYWVKTRSDFPRPIKLGPRTTVFPVNELVEWRGRQMRGAECSL